MTRPIESQGLINQIETAAKTVSEQHQNPAAQQEAFAEELEKKSAERTKKAHETEDPDEAELRRRDERRKRRKRRREPDEEDDEDAASIYDPAEGRRPQDPEAGCGRSIDVEV